MSIKRLELALIVIKIICSHTYNVGHLLFTQFLPTAGKKKKKAKFSLPALPCSQLLLLHTNHSKADTHLKIDQRMQMEKKSSVTHLNMITVWQQCLGKRETFKRRKRTKMESEKDKV